MMNKAELFRKIGGILSELNDQYEYIAANPGSLNELELELFSANADFLSEHTKILLKLAMARPSKLDPAHSETSEPAPVVADKSDFSSSSSDSNVIKAEKDEETTVLLPPVADFHQDNQAHVTQAAAEPVPSFSEIAEIPLEKGPQQPAIAELKQEPEAVPAQAELIKQPVIPEVVADPVPSEPAVIVPEPVNRPEPVTSPISGTAPEPFVPATPRVQTLNELISGKRSADSSVGEKFTTQPIADLKSGVSLNDKLLFIKELFNGYSLAYSEAIEILNRFDSFQAAEAFLKANYAGKNNWEAKHSTAEKFYDILRRRFS